MKLIIDIHKDQYEFIKQSMTMDKVKDYHALLYDICEHIANGTPLPKGHGRLIDADELLKKNLGADYDCRITSSGIINAPTVLEADTESKDK